MQWLALSALLLVGQDAPAEEPVTFEAPQQEAAEDTASEASETTEEPVVVNQWQVIAQNKANRNASWGRWSHAGTLAGQFEGVGAGSTPQAALNSCCRPGRGAIRVASAVAQGANGMWYAVQGYVWNANAQPGYNSGGNYGTRQRWRPFSRLFRRR